MNLSRKILVLTMLVSTSAFAQMMPPGPPGPPPAEALATIPGLTTAQQVELRRILIQRRDAQDAAHAKARSEMEALHIKERSEAERIDEQYTDQLRKALGDDGYKNYALWDLAHRGPPDRGPRMERDRPGRPDGGPMPHDGHAPAGAPGE
jgi:hypothetical protein